MKQSSETQIEKRIESRHSTNADVICQPFASDLTRISYGVMHNFSREGAYIETSIGSKFGTILLLQIAHNPKKQIFSAAKEQPPFMCLAEVKWKQELVDEYTIHYAIGLKQLD